MFGPGWPPNTPYACAEARRTQVADATFRDMHDPQQLRNPDLRTFADICVFLREICVLFAGKLSTFLLNSEQFWNFLQAFLQKKHGRSVFFTN